MKFAATLLIPIAFAVSSCIGISENFDNLNAGVEGFDQPIRKVERELSREDIIGTYRFGDGFWNWEIHIEEDNTFAHVWISDTLVTDKEGNTGLETGVDLTGSWALIEDSIVFNFGKEEEYRIVLVGSKPALIEPRIRVDYHRVYVKTESPLTFRNEK